MPGDFFAHFAELNANGSLFCAYFIMARREKKPVHRVEMTEGKRNIIRQLLQEYDIETAEDMNLRTFFWTLFTKVIRVLHDIPLGLIRLASS